MYENDGKFAAQCILIDIFSPKRIFQSEIQRNFEKNCKFFLPRKINTFF